MVPWHSKALPVFGGGEGSQLLIGICIQRRWKRLIDAGVEVMQVFVGAALDTPADVQEERWGRKLDLDDDHTPPARRARFRRVVRDMEYVVAGVSSSVLKHLRFYLKADLESILESVANRCRRCKELLDWGQQVCGPCSLGMSPDEYEVWTAARKECLEWREARRKHTALKALLKDRLGASSSRATGSAPPRSSPAS